MEHLMVVAYTGDKGEPELVATGASPTFAADVTEIAAWFQAGRTFRKFTNYAALAAATGEAGNDLGIVDTIPGAWFKYDGTAAAWVMFGTPRFADSSARSTALTAPVLGMKTVLTSDEITYRYNGSAWKAWESDWITYTSTLTGFVVGTGGTNSTDYRYEQGMVRVRFTFKFGTSGQTFPTDPKFTLPVNRSAQVHTYEEPGGFVSMHDNSAASLPRAAICFANATSVTQVILYGLGTATTGTPYNISTTLPWTWAQNDVIRGELTYTPA
jgi:hypothetical protein